jgi:hypothetical protein
MGAEKCDMLTKPACKVISLYMKNGVELKIPLLYVIKAEVEEGKNYLRIFF